MAATITGNEPGSKWLHSLKVFTCSACGFKIPIGHWFLHFEDGKDACIMCALGPDPLPYPEDEEGPAMPEMEPVDLEAVLVA